MHYTLHLTNKCNMACDYCYVEHDNAIDMSIETARKAVDLAAVNDKGSAGIVFFGGEPLLCKDKIYQVIEYCRWKEKQQDCRFHFKVTTNGLLLDEEFMDFSLRENIFIALSHDGIRQAHDRHRKDADGKGTFASLCSKLDLLITERPYTPVLMVVNPDTAQYFAVSVIYLYEMGFRYIICSLNYAACWTDKDMRELEKQYIRLSEFYYDRIMAEDKFYLSPFEVKISSHINKDSYCRERCELGRKQISVAPDGRLFPCVQFVGDNYFSIGHVDTGIDEPRQDIIFKKNEEEKESCMQCAIKKRCNHYCGCMNKQSTGYIDRVSPVQCRHEQMLLPIADRLAERLYRKRSAMFIQKHYNDMFPILSLIEDKSKGI